MKNPIIEEVRKARAALAAEHGYDLQRIHEWAKAAHELRKKVKGKTVAGKSESGTIPKTKKVVSNAGK